MWRVVVSLLSVLLAFRRDRTRGCEGGRWSERGGERGRDVGRSRGAGRGRVVGLGLVHTLVLVLGLGAASCAAEPSRQLDHDLIRVTKDANLRTDTIGDGKFTELATFVLVEAENTSKEGAYVTLGGELTDGDTVVSELRAQSLWIPAGELRTFALIDKERKPRSNAKAARIHVRGAMVPKVPPPMTVDGVHEVVDGDKTVVQAVVDNPIARGGNVMVFAVFWDAGGKPLTRPFSLIWVPAKTKQPVQFVGPAGSKRGTIFLGDTAY